MEEKPNYYSILTADVRYDKELKANEKLLFSEITALSNKYGYCTASNGYLADLYDVKKTTVSHWLIHLKEKNYIRIEIERNDKKEIISRKIYPVSNPIVQKSNRYSTNNQDPIVQKSKENITSINNINISDKDNSESNNTNRFNYSKFINSINEEANTNFRNSSNNRKLIHARLADGYTEEELIKVIKFKANQWKDNEKMKKYIALTTLLRPSNFDKYIQEVESSPEPQKKKEESSAKEEKRKDPIEEKIYQYKLFLQEQPDNEDVRKELERLERDRAKSGGNTTEQTRTD